jgi:hypothetical protein
VHSHPLNGPQHYNVVTSTQILLKHSKIRLILDVIHFLNKLHLLSAPNKNIRIKKKEVNTTLKKFINLHVEVDENKGRRFFKVIFLEKEKKLLILLCLIGVLFVT